MPERITGETGVRSFLDPQGKNIWIYLDLLGKTSVRIFGKSPKITTGAIREKFSPQISGEITKDYFHHNLCGNYWSIVVIKDFLYQILK